MSKAVNRKRKIQIRIIYACMIVGLLLLTWLIEDTRLFEVIRPYITPEDFTEELYREVARTLFAQYESTGEVNAARIISGFPEEENQRAVAGLFNAVLKEPESAAEREKALKETILRVKRAGIEYRSTHLDPTDMQALMQVVEDKKQLQKLERMHFSLDAGRE